MNVSSVKSVIRRVLNRLSPSLTRAILGRRTARLRIRADAIEWQSRIADVLTCPDNQRLPRVPGAGEIHDGFQLMFNGLKVAASGYYGTGMTELLRRNRGSHEPQEEAVFADVLRRLPPGASLMECGAYWGFYSMWFMRDVPQGTVWLIEPEIANLEVGRRNFLANGLQGHFTCAFVGKDSAPSEIPRICVDDFLAQHGIAHLDILHADIQGAEADMLDGTARALAGKTVDYFFISTHGADVHHACVQRLVSAEYEVPVSILPEESYSVDGVVVAHRHGLLHSPLLIPSMKTASPSQTR